MYTPWVAGGPVQFDEVVQSLLAGWALTLPRTSLASIWSGITINTAVAGHTSISNELPCTDQENPFARLQALNLA